MILELYVLKGGTTLDLKKERKLKTLKTKTLK